MTNSSPVPSEADQPNTSSDTLRVRGTFQSAPVPLDDRINILLVDDEPKNLTVLETILDAPEYRLVRATSADQALLALVREQFALIILDIQMPEMTGFELAAMVKQRKKTASVPIIFLTAFYGESEHVQEGYGTGAVDYLHKPVNPIVLRSKVAVFASLHRKSREIELTNEALQVEIAERRRIEEQLLELNNELERRVIERTSELSQANKAITDSEELLRLAQEAGRVGIWDWNLSTRETTWTSNSCEMFGADRPCTTLLLNEWLDFIHPEDRARAQASIESAVLSGTYRDELRLVSQGDTSRWIELVGAVVFEEGIASRMRGTIRDITDRKTIELELKEADRRKDEFLATLAHELRNPLAPIRNALQIMAMVENDLRRTGSLRDMMERQVVQMIRLIDDLLDLSRISTGKIDLRMESIRVDQILNNAIEVSLPLIEAARHQFHTEYQLDPSTSLVGDLTRLSQVISNLLNNAAKYTPEGGQIVLSVGREADSVTIQVRDTGVGIPRDMLPRVFEMFAQIDRNLHRAQGGLGIGLSLVRKLVGMHGGTVTAFSAGEGLGSEFTICLPLPSPDSPAASA